MQVRLCWTPVIVLLCFLRALASSVHLRALPSSWKATILLTMSLFFLRCWLIAWTGFCQDVCMCVHLHAYVHMERFSLEILVSYIYITRHKVALAIFCTSGSCTWLYIMMLPVPKKVLQNSYSMLTWVLVDTVNDYIHTGNVWFESY